MDYLYILGTILFTVYGQIITKWQVGLAGPMPADIGEKINFLTRLVHNPWVISSLTAAFLAFLCWVGAMTKFELSYAYPFTSLSFVLVLIISVILFRETVTLPKILGLAFIIVGTVLGSRG
ncbi:MAG: SMR family transporter [Chloroflexi bacterium]|nr:SMR family transporter [Chloroflexota bacterium]